MDAENRAAGVTESHEAPSATLRGRWLLLARVAWLAVALLAVGLFAAGIPPHFAELQTACTRGADVCSERGLLASDQVQELQALGLSTGFYATYTVALKIVSTLVWCTAGAVIFWRKSEDRMALLVALMLVTFETGTQGFSDVLADAYPILSLPVQLLTVLGFTSIILFLYLFPDGRFVPRWTLLPALAWIANDTVSVLFPDLSTSYWWDAPIGFVLFFVPAVCAVGSQIYRYRRTSDPAQRQQTKWVIFGIAVGFGGYLVLVILQGIFLGFDQTGLLGDLIVQTMTTLLFLVIPLSIGVAILRSRLWDIDVVINRALVYGTLTATLALVYVGGVVSLQYVFRAITGGTSQLAIVASTLVIAALFQPLRRRVQTTIDRCFYRKKYDAEKTLAAFGARLRDEVELDTLSDDLVEVVRETLQPAHVSLWLRESERKSEEA
jgi:hypothetical protein